MKRTFLMTMLLTLGLRMITVLAADGAGNGGGTWVCHNSDQPQTIHWAKFVDLYEAENEFLLQLKNFGNKNYQEIVDAQKVKLLSINKNLYERLRPYFDKVKNKIREIDVDLKVVDDALYRVRPPARDCHGGKVEYVQLANYTHYGTILVNQYLFNNRKLAEIDKAALIFHEVIYEYLRDSYGDSTSTKTRKIVGYLFSNLKQSEIKEKVDLAFGYINDGLLGMKLVPILRGSFIMGSPATVPEIYDDHVVQRHVTITYSYSMMTTEVTQAMYFELTGKNPSWFKNRRDCLLDFESRVSHTTGRKVTLCPHNPVESLTFYEIQKFITLLNEKTGMNYRLPTEAEWEYAARAGSQSVYSFGDNATLLNQYAIYGRNSKDRTHPVGPIRDYADNPSRNGLYDMHGNVWEWTQDWYTKSPSGGVNPTGPASAISSSDRVIRGGSFRQSSVGMRSDFRSYNSSLSRFNGVGFRLVRTID